MYAETSLVLPPLWDSAFSSEKWGAQALLSLLAPLFS